MKNILKKLHDEITKAPVVVQFDKKRWFELQILFEPDGEAVIFVFYSHDYAESTPFIKKLLQTEPVQAPIYSGVFIKMSFEKYKAAYFDKIGSEPTIFDAKEVIEAVKKRIRRLGYRKFATFVNKIFLLDFTEQNVQSVVDNLESAVDFALSVLLLYSFRQPAYPISKKTLSTISTTVEKLLTYKDPNFVVKEAYSNKRVNRISHLIFPKKWGVDERILLYDVILREYALNPRSKLVLVRGKQKLDFSNTGRKEIIIITPEKIRKWTRLDKYSVSRIASKFENLLQDILVFQGYYKGIPTFAKYILIKPLDKSGLKGYLLGLPDNVRINIDFYELTDFAQDLFKIESKNYVEVEGATFSQLKATFPDRSQFAAARLLERILQKGRKAFLTLEEAAILIGKQSYINYRKKNAIREYLVKQYFKPMKAHGVINMYRFRGEGFEIWL